MNPLPCDTEVPVLFEAIIVRTGASTRDFLAGSSFATFDLFCSCFPGLITDSTTIEIASVPKSTANKSGRHRCQSDRLLKRPSVRGKELGHKTNRTLRQKDSERRIGCKKTSGYPNRLQYIFFED
jgi:hypothetical protein